MVRPKKSPKIVWLCPDWNEPTSEVMPQAFKRDVTCDDCPQKCGGPVAYERRRKSR